MSFRAGYETRVQEQLTGLSQGEIYSGIVPLSVPQRHFQCMPLTAHPALLTEKGLHVSFLLSIFSSDVR